MASKIEVMIPHSSVLSCPRCSVDLDQDAERLRCPKCGEEWDIKEGIPRFYEPDYYWGEVSQLEASKLLADARRDSWREAVECHFAQDKSLLVSILDWHYRTSWLAMLGFGRNAVALDIGSGYGAITHSLAKSFGAVYSVEPIPERIEFTRVRLEQEGLSNVHLLQASALQLPLADNLFDLVVVNGILEWVGEWETTGDPRMVQLSFLRKVHRVLKPGGLLVLGIENRIGYGNFLGATDHSGLPYTSLLPRFLASIVLRHSEKRHHRTQINPKRQYRTYTYSARGYRKILQEAGFHDPTFFWADPGYNIPGALVPLQKRILDAHIRRVFSQSPGGFRRRLRRLPKSILGSLGLLKLFVPEFIIIAAKEQKSETPEFVRPESARLFRGVQPLLTESLQIRQPVYYLTGAPANNRWRISISELHESRPKVILKAARRNSKQKQLLASELRCMSVVGSRQVSEQNHTLSVPLPLGSFEIDDWFFTLESAAKGRQLSEFFANFVPRGRKRLGFVRQKLAHAADIAIQISNALKQVSPIAAVEESWFSIPDGLKVSEASRKLVTDEVEKCRRHRVRAHGDFTIENILWERATDKMTVVDWEHSIEGVPRIYDVVSLLLSALPALTLEYAPLIMANNQLEREFLTIFFGSGPLAEIAREIILSSSNKSAVDAEVWGELLLSLTIRTNYLLARDSSFGQVYSRFVELADEQLHQA